MTTPERPTDPAWTHTAASVEPGSPDSASERPAPVAPRLPIAPGRKPSASNSRVVNLLLGLAAVIAVGGLAFAAGRMTVPAAATTGDGNGPGAFGNGNFPDFGNGGGGGGAGFQGGVGGVQAAGVLEGTIVAVTGDSLTLQIGTAAAGGQGIEIVIPLSSTTAVHTQASASSRDLASGQKVLVQLGTPEAGSTPAPAASGAPRQVQAPASDVTIVTP